MAGNYILCNYVCDVWRHKRFSSVLRSLSNVINYVCSGNSGNQTFLSGVESNDTGNESLHCTDKLCYLGDVISAGDGTGSGSSTRFISGGKLFTFSLHKKGKLYVLYIIIYYVHIFPA